MRLLIVEDEENFAKSLKKILQTESYAVDIAATGDEGYEMAFDEEYDLIILDLGLPGMDGLKIIEELRKKKNSTPVIMLTARDTVDDKVKGLKLGADDYLVKPFEFEELLARIQALLRRPKISINDKLIVGNLVLDSQSKIVKRKGQIIDLTAKEFALLEYLMRHKGQVLTKQQLIDHVWDADLDIFSNTVDVYIGYLRTKIDKALPKEKSLIKTIRGMGYKIENYE
jgi:DNA-binding response OmpR family regulator